MIKLRRRLIRIDWFTIGVALGCFALYLALFGRFYLSRKIVHGSDTHGVWSLTYLTLYSIKNFDEFPWWDPTGLGGWPIYSYLLNWSFNYFTPYAFPFFAAFKLVSTFVPISPRGLNTAIVIQKVVYYFLLNLAAVLLIAHELLRSRVARAFVAIAFTLSVIQFQGFRDSHQYEALPGALFYLFALLHFDRNRTHRALFLLILFAGLYLSSGSYAVTLSALYWTGLFTVLFVMTRPGLLVDGARLVAAAWRRPWSRAGLLAGGLLLIAGFAAPASSVVLNAGNLLRITGAKPLDYGVGVFGDWDPPNFGATGFELWTNLMYFAPFFELHDAVLSFDPWHSGIDHRYIGLAAVPLLAVALTLGLRRRGTVPLFLTVFVCVVFVAYTVNNLAFAFLMKFPLFQNVRTMPNLLARDGGALFLILIAAIGLDTLVTHGSPVSIGPRSTVHRDERRLRHLLMALLAGVIVLAGLSLVLIIQPSFSPIRHTLAHAGLYLVLFCFLALLLLLIEHPRTRRAITLIFLVLTATDLIVSSSYYFLRRPGYMMYENDGSWTKPRPATIGPISSSSENWPGKYRGIFHNLAGGPWVGTREWLVLATRPKLETLTDTWDYQGLTMRAYPRIRFFTNGRYLPFEEIRRIDRVAVPSTAGAWVYLHDEKLVQSRGQSDHPEDVAWTVRRFTFNRLRVAVSAPRDVIMVYYDNYNKYFTARIDGRPVPIYRANFTYKAVELPAGDHMVEWVFNPYPVKVSWLVFYLSLLVYLFIYRRAARDPEWRRTLPALTPPPDP